MKEKLFLAMEAHPSSKIRETVRRLREISGDWTIEQLRDELVALLTGKK